MNLDPWESSVGRNFLQSASQLQMIRAYALQMSKIQVYGSIRTLDKALCCFGPFLGDGRLNKCEVVDHTDSCTKSPVYGGHSVGSMRFFCYTHRVPVRRGRSREALPLLRLTPSTTPICSRSSARSVSDAGHRTDSSTGIHPKLGGA